MFLIKGQIRALIAVIFPFTVLIGCMPAQNANPAPKATLQEKVIHQADEMYKQGRYMDGQLILKRFNEKFPQSALTDDAAYRLAYLHVIADAQNPFYDYTAAKQAFERFQEKFPGSAYISACKNWLKILNLHFAPEKKKNQPGMNIQVELERLHSEISKLKAENNQLRNTLTELEKALER